MSARESPVLRDVLLATSPRGLVWRNNRGAGCLTDRCGRVISQWMQFGGPPGAADVLGSIARPAPCPTCGSRGVPFACETKSDRGRQTPEQRIFGEAWTRAGGLYVLARSAADAESAIEVATSAAADTHR